LWIYHRGSCFPGLEIDVRIVKRNMRASSLISVAGLLVPLGLGAALGVGIYKEFIDPKVNFGYFLLFTAVAIGITAFPVLCRILTELKLLDTPVGVVVLSAGVGNDVVGWILLALTVALVNAGSGLTALYVLLASVGFVLFLLYPVRFGYMWLARRTGSLEQGSPSRLMMTVTLIMILGSAFMTDILGEWYSPRIVRSADSYLAQVFILSLVSLLRCLLFPVG
jgi:Kef-type K+ transport system membrane component KefB